MKRNVAIWIAVVVATLIVGGCEPSNITPIPSFGPNMSAIATSSLTLENKDGRIGGNTDQSFAVVGFDGAVPPLTIVRIHHQRLDVTHEKTASDTGSFAFHLLVQLDDAVFLSVQADESTPESEPVALTPPQSDVGIAPPRDTPPIPSKMPCPDDPHMGMDWVESGVCSLHTDECLLGAGYDIIAANLRTGEVLHMELDSQKTFYGEMHAALDDQFLVFGQGRENPALTTDAHIMDAPPPSDGPPEEPGS